MRLRWESDALDDLVELRTYIESDNPGAAKRTVSRILSAVLLLVEQPLLGRPGRIPDTRELVIKNTLFTVIYHVTAEVTTVLRVFHQARRWPERR